ncbi:uncharacterized protein PGTG_02109 [Puccinia graminis f. sp. tritici CRL 75-36-700-3]|uniref:Uncharacterized protein n=1 Tax=Puccinia graminis f. sp. tritici (strain CRL 75-36-700-3 / race SCCL) TaxID=418459 RepID=E3JX73_PUCGT|nr:uncharacterized protein PGTG_02109 [Puccinia graminis f. sp. tritici CRL 75-36-700-3]EFP76648.2 hypothetical protein PGTG_02109 [Puccinia graminis f. sp. tritici CRL 75-36-700-3]
MRLLLIVAALIPFAYLQEPGRQVQRDGTGFVDRLGENEVGDPIAIGIAPAKRKTLYPLNKPNNPKPKPKPKPKPQPKPSIILSDQGGGYIQHPKKENPTLTLYSAADGYYSEMFN